jgi:hypothetical protein
VGIKNIVLTFKYAILKNKNKNKNCGFRCVVDIGWSHFIGGKMLLVRRK